MDAETTTASSLPRFQVLSPSRPPPRDQSCEWVVRVLDKKTGERFVVGCYGSLGVANDDLPALRAAWAPGGSAVSS